MLVETGRAARRLCTPLAEPLGRWITFSVVLGIGLCAATVRPDGRFDPPNTNGNAYGCDDEKSRHRVPFAG